MQYELNNRASGYSPILIDNTDKDGVWLRVGGTGTWLTDDEVDDLCVVLQAMKVSRGVS